MALSALEPVSVRVEHGRDLDKRSFGIGLLVLQGKTARQRRARANGGNGFPCHRAPPYSSKEVKKARPKGHGHGVHVFAKLAIGDGTYDFNKARRVVMGSAPPTTGAWALADMVINDGTVTALATTDHWRCSVAGTPGTWIAK